MSRSTSNSSSAKSLPQVEVGNQVIRLSLRFFLPIFFDNLLQAWAKGGGGSTELKKSGTGVWGPRCCCQMWVTVSVDEEDEVHESLE